jgi:hypothetical protein
MVTYVGPSPGGFLPGLELSEAFYVEAVEPIMRLRFPEPRYAAARIGPGSDVLGFDDWRSTDHFWGPLLNLFLSEEDAARYRVEIQTVLGAELPFDVRGFPVNFRPFEGADALNHSVMVNALRPYMRWYLGIDPSLAHGANLESSRYGRVGEDATRRLRCIPSIAQGAFAVLDLLCSSRTTFPAAHRPNAEALDSALPSVA